MYQSRGNNGPLNIIKLPDCDPPVWDELKSLNASNFKSLKDLNTPDLKSMRITEEILQFYDINENYD
jgi:hypothetical protein